MVEQVEKYYIPLDIKKIHPYAFSGNTHIGFIITSPTIEEVGSHAFEKCSSMYEFYHLSSTQMEDSNQFDGCTTLQTVIIPETVQSINSKAFVNCPSLKTVRLPLDKY